MAVPTIAQLQASWAYAPDGGTITYPIPLTPVGPVNSASLQKGFPQITMPNDPEIGDPPNGQDFNGILNQLSQLAVGYSVGLGFAYNATIYNNTNPYITGYPVGARVMRADNQGYWINLLNNNQTDPDNAGVSANWVPDSVYGFYQYVIASALTTTITVGIPDAAKYGILVSQSTTPGGNINLVLPETLLKPYYIRNTSTVSLLIKTSNVGTNTITLLPGAEIIIFVYSTTVISSLSTTFSLKPNIGSSAFYTSGSGTAVALDVLGVVLPLSQGPGETWISGNVVNIPWTGSYTGFATTSYTLGSANQIQFVIQRNGSLFSTESADVPSALSGSKSIPFSGYFTVGDTIRVIGRIAGAGPSAANIINFQILAVAN